MNNKSLREKILIGMVVVILVSFLGYNFGYLKLVDYREELEDEVALLSGSDTNIGTLREDENAAKERLSNLKEAIEEIKDIKGGTTINTQDFFLFLSTKTKELGIDIVKFEDIGSVEDDGVWRATFDVELNGYLSDLMVLSESIDDIDIAYDVKSMSLRQDKDETYLERLHKNQNSLQWFSKKEEEAKAPEGNYTTTTEVGYTGESESVVEYVEEEIEIPSEEIVVETEVITETVERSADTIQEQLEILLGITPATEEIKKEIKTNVIKPTIKTNTVVKSVVKPGENTSTTKAPVVTKVDTPNEPKKVIKADKKFNDTRINMDFKIVFTMFSDPSTNYMNKDLYVSDTSGGVKEFTVDKAGGTKTTQEINDFIKNNAEYLTEEIERVMAEITELNDADKDSLKIKEYLNYLLSKR